MQVDSSQYLSSSYLFSMYVHATSLRLLNRRLRPYEDILNTLRRNLYWRAAILYTVRHIQLTEPCTRTMKLTSNIKESDVRRDGCNAKNAILVIFVLGDVRGSWLTTHHFYIFLIRNVTFRCKTWSLIPYGVVLISSWYRCDGFLDLSAVLKVTASFPS